MGISVAAVGRGCVLNVCQPLGAVGGQGQPSHPEKCFLKSLSSKIIHVEIRYNKRGFQAAFIVVLSKFLMIISQDYSLLYWKLEVGVGWLVFRYIAPVSLWRTKRTLAPCPALPSPHLYTQFREKSVLPLERGVGRRQLIPP